MACNGAAVNNRTQTYVPCKPQIKETYTAWKLFLDVISKGFDVNATAMAYVWLQRPESCFPMTTVAAEDTRKSKKFSRLWPKVKKILESKVIIRKSNG